MGAWGPGLYSDDTAREVRDVIQEIVRLPKSGDELLDVLFQACPPGNESDDDYTITWLVAADQFHKYGIACARLFHTASQLIEEGADDAAMARLEMSATDRRKRAKALASLRAKWSAPAERPASRRVLHAPVSNPVSQGDVWAYPTSRGNSANVLDSLTHIQKNFAPDGWSAFVVAQTGTQFDVKPIAYVVRLHLSAEMRPDLKSCRSAHVGGVLVGQLGDTEPRATAGWVTLTTSDLRKLGAEKIGKINVDWEIAQELLPHTELTPATKPLPIHNALHVSTGGDLESPELSDRPMSYGIPLSNLFADD